MKNLTSLLLAYSVFIFTSCEKEYVKGEGILATQQRPIGNFTGVRAKGSANVFITQGPVVTAKVKDYENLLPYFEMKLNGTVLEVGFKENVNIKSNKTEVFITMPTLDLLKTEGSGNITATGIYPAVANFKAQIAGSGNISIESCFANRFDGLIKGSGNVNAFGLPATEAYLQTEGSGNFETTASNKLNVKISGSGNVYYKLSPVVTANISGSGQVIPR